MFERLFGLTPEVMNILLHQHLFRISGNAFIPSGVSLREHEGVSLKHQRDD